MHCRNTIRTSVKRLPGIISTDVDPPGKTVSVTFEPHQVKVEQIREKIEAAGYRVV